MEARIIELSVLNKFAINVPVLKSLIAEDSRTINRGYSSSSKFGRVKLTLTSFCTSNFQKF